MSSPLSTPRPSLVVVGVDGTAGSEAALRWAADHGRSIGSPVRAVLVVGAPAVPLDPLGGFGWWAEPDPFDAALILERSVERAVADPDLRATIERRVVFGTPADRLAAEAAPAGMLVLGQSRRSLTRLLFGTVRQLVTTAPCPVVVIPNDVVSAVRARPLDGDLATAGAARAVAGPMF